MGKVIHKATTLYVRIYLSPNISEALDFRYNVASKDLLNNLLMKNKTIYFNFYSSLYNIALASPHRYPYNKPSLALPYEPVFHHHSRHLLMLPIVCTVLIV